MSGGLRIKMRCGGSRVKSIAIGNSQDKGARDYQEDSFGFSPLDSATVSEYGFIAAAADGMGGLSCGDKASSFTVSSVISARMDKDGAPPHIQFTQMVRDINGSVIGSGLGGGCTLAAVYCCEKGLYWCSVGDSRIYLLREEKLCCLTEDKDYMNILSDRVLNGGISYDEACSDPQKDSLAEYIGFRGSLSPDVNIRPFSPKKRDRILICSDGVYNALSDEEMTRSLLLHAREAADDIRNKIVMKGFANQDNFTSIVLEFI